MAAAAEHSEFAVGVISDYVYGMQILKSVMFHEFSFGKHGIKTIITIMITRNT